MSEQFHLQWPVDQHVVNQYFGENPDFYRPFGLAGHEGLDLFAPMNANIYAGANGEVTQAAHPANHPYGLQVRLKHTVGGVVYTTIYAHLAQVTVSVGQQVEAGQLIAKADNTGNSFGSHLHLTLKIAGAQTAGFPAGIVDPWPYMQAVVQDLPPASDLIVYASDILSLRAGPTTDSNRLTALNQGEPLTVLGDAKAAEGRIGRQGEWLQVQTQTGLSGYVAAWFVHRTGQALPSSDLTVYAQDLLSVRAQPSTEGNRLTIVSPQDPLTVLGDPDGATAKIGKQDQWLNVRAPSGHVGYVAAWFLLPPGAMPSFSFTPSQFLTVYPTADLHLRAQPSINSPHVLSANPTTPLYVLDEDLDAARATVGKKGQWLYVDTDAGERGWVPTQHLRLDEA